MSHVVELKQERSEAGSDRVCVDACRILAPTWVTQLGFEQNAGEKERKKNCLEWNEVWFQRVERL